MAKAKKVKAQIVDNRVVKFDDFDTLAFEKVEKYERIEEIALQPETDEARKQRTDLLHDVFTAFYTSEAEILPDKTGITKDVVQEFLSMTEYKNFQHSSRFDYMASAIGTIQMSPVLVEKIDEFQKQIEEQREKQREQNKEEEGKDENEGIPEHMSLDELGPEAASLLRQAVRVGLEKVEEENQEAKAIFQTWGVDPGQLEKMDPQERLELNDKLRESKELQDMSDIMGRFRNVLSAASAMQPSHGYDEIVDLTTTGEISRMLPTEMLKLGHNPVQFYKDLLERSLLGYEMKGEENIGKGPLIVAWDRSWSMSGKRETWAVATVLTLMQFAQKQNRAFAWLCFDSNVHDSGFCPKGRPIPIEDKLRIAEMGCSGGTNFWSALEECMDLHKNDPQLKPADIVFITDGECMLSDREGQTFAQWKKEKDVRVFGIGISDSSHREHAEFETLDRFCDHVAMVNNLGEVSALRQVLQQTGKRN